LRKARIWVSAHPATARFKNDKAPNELGVIDALLASNEIRPDQTWELQALGVVFGDALARKLMLEWVTVEDEFGKDPALNWPGTSLLCYPLTMISKRIESGEAVDATDMLERTSELLSEMAFSGRYE